MLTRKTQICCTEALLDNLSLRLISFLRVFAFSVCLQIFRKEI